MRGASLYLSMNTFCLDFHSYCTTKKVSEGCKITHGFGVPIRFVYQLHIKPKIPNEVRLRCVLCPIYFSICYTSSQGSYLPAKM